MYKTTLIPDSSNVNINFPKSYIGKKVNALFYIDEEITQDINESIYVEKTKLPANKLDIDIEKANKFPKISPLVEKLTGVIPNEKDLEDDYYEYLTKKHS